MVSVKTTDRDTTPIALVFPSLYRAPTTPAATGVDIVQSDPNVLTRAKHDPSAAKDTDLWEVYTKTVNFRPVRSFGPRHHDE